MPIVAEPGSEDELDMLSPFNICGLRDMVKKGSQDVADPLSLLPGNCVVLEGDLFIVKL